MRLTMPARRSTVLAAVAACGLSMATVCAQLAQEAFMGATSGGSKTHRFGPI